MKSSCLKYNKNVMTVYEYNTFTANFVGNKRDCYGIVMVLKITQKYNTSVWKENLNDKLGAGKKKSTLFCCILTTEEKITSYKINQERSPISVWAYEYYNDCKPRPPADLRYYNDLIERWSSSDDSKKYVNFTSQVTGFNLNYSEVSIST